MGVKLLTEHHLEFLSLKRGYTGSSESTLVKCHNVGNHMSRLNHHVSTCHNAVYRKNRGIQMEMKGHGYEWKRGEGL